MHSRSRLIHQVHAMFYCYIAAKNKSSAKTNTFSFPLLCLLKHVPQFHRQQIHRLQMDIHTDVRAWNVIISARSAITAGGRNPRSETQFILPILEKCHQKSEELTGWDGSVWKCKTGCKTSNAFLLYTAFPKTRSTKGFKQTIEPRYVSEALSYRAGVQRTTWDDVLGGAHWYETNRWSWRTTSEYRPVTI